MINQCYRLFCSLMLFAIHLTANAALELELTQGVNGAEPLAILPFSVQGSMNKDIQQVIYNDLTHSGRFNVIPMTQKMVELNTPVNYMYWQQRKVDNIVQGQLRQDKQGRIQLTLHLDNAYKDPHPVAETLITTDAADWRDLAHHASDWIYEQITGQHGVFSTHLAYVVVLHHPGIRTAYRLEVSDIDGARSHILFESSQPIMSPAWSPDGKSIAYVSFEAHHAQIYKVILATGERELITDYPGVNGAPSWSPDGQRLALVLSKQTYPNIYIYNLVTHSLKQLTHSWSINTEPQWTPDGRAILFTSDRGGHAQIYRLDLGTRAITRLTFNGPFHARSQVTPDNKLLITLHRADGLYNIAISDLESGRMRLLTKTGRVSSPSISPNGRMVAYATRNGGRGVLEIVAIDGKVTWRLPASEGDVQEPAWSPYFII